MYHLSKNLQDYSLEKIPNLSEKTVILRSCLNVSVNEDGKVVDSTRIIESLPTIKYLADNAKKLIILGHLGRPKSYSKELSFWNIATVIEENLGTGYNVNLLAHGTNLDIENRITLIDNIRFFENEESKDLEKRMGFAKQLAEMGDVFVNDAFADYRESASTYDIAKVLPSFLGYKFIQEVEQLSKLSNPEKPFVAVLGGSKLSEKLDVLNSLGQRADKIIIGGAMAYTIMKAQGISVGNSKVEDDKLDVAKEIAEKYGEKLILPVDHLLSDEFSEYSSYEYSEGSNISEDCIAIDIGWKTIELYKQTISSAKTILWNGPMGVVEWKHSEVGTKEIGSAISQSDGYKIVGGGDSITAINKFNLDNFDHICTGGGAMLAFLANESFPTLDVIIAP